jgi:CRISPR-associated protein Csa1
VFYTFSDVARLCRTFRGMPCEVSEELRGWSWSSPPLLYPYSFQLSVSDVANSFCESGRFVYLKYVAKERERPGWRLRRGSLVHYVLSEASRTAKSIILSGVSEPQEFKSEFMEKGRKVLSACKEQFKELKDVETVFELLWLRAMDAFSSELAKAASRSPYLPIDGLAFLVAPFTAEFPVDGSLVGLSRTLRVDLMVYPSIMVEVKTRKWHQDYELGLTAYALAFESQYEVPINHGVVALVRIDASKRDLKVYERVVKISDGLRQAFIDRRDSYARIVEEAVDPGKAKNCDPDCPYLHICREG